MYFKNNLTSSIETVLDSLLSKRIYIFSCRNGLFILLSKRFFLYSFLKTVFILFVDLFAKVKKVIPYPTPFDAAVSTSLYCFLRLDCIISRPARE